ncbi:hypothetical protein OIU76_001735 [Salix suchowensis]|nr:hypothetical protein OIU76_001735 [Salix suchowensis]
MTKTNPNVYKIQFHVESLFNKSTTSLMAGLSTIISSVHKEAILKYSLTSSPLKPSLCILRSKISM